MLFFVPLGVERLLGKRLAVGFLAVCVVAQGLWQWEYRGSSRSEAAAQSARIIEQRFSGSDLLIQNSEVYVELPPNPHWLYLPTPGTAEFIPESMRDLTGKDRCLPVIRKMVTRGPRATTLSGAYVYIAPPLDCQTVH